MLEVSNTQHQEGNVEGEEEREEGHSGAEGTDEEESREDEPAEEVETEGVEEEIGSVCLKILLDVEAAGGEDDGERQPEASVR